MGQIVLGIFLSEAAFARRDTSPVEDMLSSDGDHPCAVVEGEVFGAVKVELTTPVRPAVPMTFFGSSTEDGQRATRT